MSCTVQDGGVGAIVVIDNGSGFARDDLAVVAQSYCTSKLKRFEDLRSLATYGFRGEGLHAIASQARLQISSRQAGAPQGFAVTISHAQGAETVSEPTAEEGLDEGTMVRVENLFVTLPVRLQGLRERRDAAMTALQKMFTAYALARPNVTFRLDTPPKPPFQALAKPTLALRVEDMYGPVFWSEVDIFKWTPTADDGDNLENVCDFVCILPKPSLDQYKASVQTRSRKFVTVNRRPVDLDMMTKLINKMFRAHSGMSKSYYPYIMLALTLPTDRYDINQSRDKRTISLSDESPIIEFLTNQLEELYPPKHSQINLSSQSSSVGTPPSRPGVDLIGVGGALNLSSPITPFATQPQLDDVTPPIRQPNFFAGAEDDTPFVATAVAGTPMARENSRQQSTQYPQQPGAPPTASVFTRAVGSPPTEPQMSTPVRPPRSEHQPSQHQQYQHQYQSESRGASGAVQSQIVLNSSQSQPLSVAAPRIPAAASGAPLPRAREQAAVAAPKSAAPKSAAPKTASSSSGTRRPRQIKVLDDDDEDEAFLAAVANEFVEARSKRTGATAGDAVKRQKTASDFVDEAPSMNREMMEVNLEWIRAQRTANDAYYAQYGPETIRGAVCSSLESRARNLTAFELLGARIVGLMPEHKDGFLLMLDDSDPPSLLLCKSVLVQEELQFQQLQATHQFSSALLSAPLFLTYENIGSRVLWDMLRDNAECQRIFLKNGFVMQPRFHDTRIDQEVVKVTHAARSIPDVGQAQFIELLKLCGQVHVQKGLTIDTQPHPKVAMDFFRIEARRMSREGLISTTLLAQEMLERLAQLVAAGTVDQKGMFTQLFQIKRGQ